MLQWFHPVLARVNPGWSLKGCHHYCYCFHHCQLPYWQSLKHLIYFLFAAWDAICIKIVDAWSTSGNVGNNKISSHQCFSLLDCCPLKVKAFRSSIDADWFYYFSSCLYYGFYSDFLVVVLFAVFVMEGVIALSGLISLVRFSGSDYVSSSSFSKL